MERILVFILFATRLASASILLQQFDQKTSKCEKINIPMCQDMPYNSTRMPNLMNHANQAEAAIEVHEYVPLVELNCSKHLKFFLCSLYAPMCTEQVDVPIPSCQSICEKVKEGCLPFLEKLNFRWPPALNCSRLPVPEKGLCMESPDITRDRKQKSRDPPVIRTEKKIFAPNPRIPPISPYVYPNIDDTHRSFGGTYDRKPSVIEDQLNVEESSKKNVCLSKHVLVSDGRLNSISQCAVKCGEDVMFTEDNKKFVEIWMTTWSVMCFISTLMTVMTFFIEPSRFRYPERPIIFMSMCYCIYSIGYLIRIFTGSSTISCDSSGPSESFVVIEGVQSTGCIIVFIILYYFGIASCIWWVNLTVTWYLAAGKKWAHEAIESLASYFHLAAWGLPAIKTIVVLTLHRVDGDELSGLCFVGNQKLSSLLYFVIIPSSIYFLIGALFLITGFGAMFRIRVIMQQQKSNSHIVVDGSQRLGVSKLEKLMARIGIFSLLYSIPALCVISCQIYEYLHRDGWKKTAWDRLAKCSTGDTSRCQLDESVPSIYLFYVKIFMSLVVGLSTAVWMWSSKTWHSWSVFCSKTIFRHKPEDKKLKRNLMTSSVRVTRTYQKNHIVRSVV